MPIKILLDNAVVSFRDMKRFFVDPREKLQPNIKCRNPKKNVFYWFLSCLVLFLEF